MQVCLQASVQSHVPSFFRWRLFESTQSVSILDQHDYFVHHDYYFICNPSTIQCVPIPPPPQVYKHKYTPVGFICDLPYCNFRSTGDQGGSMFHPNAEYRCRVVRLMCHEYQMLTPGEWIETIVSFPSPFCFVHMIHFISYANKGKLLGGHTNGVENFLIGLNPFAINKRNNTSLSSTNIIDQTNSCFTALGQNANQGFRFWPLGVYKGCLQMYRYDSGTRNLYVVDLNDEQVRLDQIWKNYSKS
ncbi:hypothetical protein ACLB2K_059142 [Fragaria x ananassa]